MRHFRVTLIYCLAVLLFWWCTATAGEGSRVYFILFDLSQSVNKAGVKDQYYGEFLKVLNQIRPGDVLIADVIRENPLSQSMFPVLLEIEKYNPFADNPVMYRMNVAHKKDSVITLVKALLFDHKDIIRWTKLTEALLVAEQVFANFKAKSGILVLCSDMVQESEKIDFLKEKLSADRISQLVKQEKINRVLPNLKGIHVRVSGASRGLYEGMSGEKIMGIKKFWECYFRECGAELVSYGAASLEFPEK